MGFRSTRFGLARDRTSTYLPPSFHAAMDAALARRQIWETVYLTYARGMDRNHNQLQADSFWDEGEGGGKAAMMHSASFHGTKKELLGKGLGGFEKLYQRIRHPIHNHFIRVDVARGRAVAETYFHDGYWFYSDEANTRSSREPAPGIGTLTVRELVGRYADELELREGRWKFTSRTVMFDFSRIDAIPASLLPAVEPFVSGFKQGTRLPNGEGSFLRDPSFAVLPARPAPAKDAGELLEKARIEQLVAVWTRELDRWLMAPGKLEAEAGGYFAPGAAVEDGTTAAVAPAEYVANLRAQAGRFKLLDRTSVISNHLIHMTGPDTAVGEVYIDLHLVVPDLAAFNPAESNKGVPGRLWFAGRYADEYAKGNDGKWRFLRRTMIQDWSRMVPHKRGLAASQAGRFTPGSFSDPASDPSVGFLPTADIRAPEMADLPRLAAVQDALHTYTRGIDRRDPSLITAAYHPGAYDDHGPYKGTAEGFVKWADAGLEAIEGCHHGITGSVVVLDGEKKARAETRVVERAWYGKDGNESVRWFVGRYLDVLEEREQGWKIASRVVVLDWSVIDPVVAKPTEKWKAMFEVGTRDATDLAARTLAKLDEGGPAKL